MAYRIQLIRPGAGHYIANPDATTDHGDGSVEGSIQWCLNQAAADSTAGHAIVELPSGDYWSLVTSQITIPRSNITIRGYGPTTHFRRNSTPSMASTT